MVCVYLCVPPGFVAVVLTLAVVPLCLYMDYNILVVYSKYRHLMATSLVLGLVVALAAYIHGHYAPKDARNPAGNSGSFLPDYFVGREVTPTVLSLDLKFVMFRITCLSLVSSSQPCLTHHAPVPYHHLITSLVPLYSTPCSPYFPAPCSYPMICFPSLCLLDVFAPLPCDWLDLPSSSSLVYYHNKVASCETFK